MFIVYCDFSPINLHTCKYLPMWYY